MLSTPRSWTGMPSWHHYYAMPAAKHYHRAECDLRGDAAPVNHAEAQSRGLTPCKRCNPPPCRRAS